MCSYREQLVGSRNGMYKTIDLKKVLLQQFILFPVNTRPKNI